jgi:transposase-like protein
VAGHGHGGHETGSKTFTAEQIILKLREAVQQTLEAEMGAALNAGKGERADGRLGYPLQNKHLKRKML